MFKNKLNHMVSCLLLLLLLFCAPLCAKEARHYEKLLSGDIQCLLCPRACLLKSGDTGFCRTRKNVDGKLESLVYAKLCSFNIDPIEKKPLYHFLPKSQTLSIATAGCNLRCVFCQNWSISQVEPHELRTMKLLPEDLIKSAKNKECPSISYTYNEPTVFFEYMYDSAWLAGQNGIKNVWVTCGYINQEPLKELCTVLDAANVDIKGFFNKTYRWTSGAKIDPILETLKTLKKEGVWLEMGYLVIPTLNDSDEEIDAMLEWFTENIGYDVPLHFLRFFPQHKLTNLPPTPISTMEHIFEKAKKSGVNYVYMGNIPGHSGNNTYCPKCKKLLIERKGYFVGEINLDNGKCRFCGEIIPGVWK